MKEALKNWWSNAEPHEKNALIVIGVISVAIFLFASGISVGKAIAVLV